MESGVREAMMLVRRSVSKVTWGFYSRVWREWEALLDEFPAMLSDLETGLLFFIGLNFGEGRSPSGMSRRLSALAFWFKLRREQDFTKAFLVRQALRGFRKGRLTRDSRRPVSYEVLSDLGEVLGVLCTSSYEARLFRAAFSLAFFGAFRVSELVAPSRSRVGGLLVEDVCLKGCVLECVIRRSKTDQLGRGARVVLQQLLGSPMCPVRVVQDYLEVRDCCGGPLLVHKDGSFLSTYQFVQVFRKGLERMGLVAKEFSSHSFRIGAATEAARWGLGPEAVKRIGRWESERYKIYVRPQLL